MAFVTAVEWGIRVSLRSQCVSAAASSVDSSNAKDGSGEYEWDARISLVDMMMSFSSISGTCCFIIDNETVLVRLVDCYGTILSLLFLHNKNHNEDDGSSGVALDIKGYLLQPLDASTSPPHPGSIIEQCQVCFPSYESVVFALDPHLYHVDFRRDLLGSTTTTSCSNSISNDSMEDDINNFQVNVWSSHYKRSDESSTITNLFKEMGRTVGLVEREIDQGKTSEIPSVSAMCCLDTPDDIHDESKRVATLHSDGSIRLWTVNNNLTQRNGTVPTVRLLNKEGQLLCHPNQWDSYHSIVMVSSVLSNQRFELAVYIKCLNGPYVYVLDGGVVGSLDVKSLNVPKDGDVVDLAWNGDGLLLLMKKERMMMFPRGEVDGVVLAEELGARSKIARLSVEEELEQYFISANADDDTMEDEDDSSENETTDEKIDKVEAAVDKAGLLSLVQPLGRQRPSAVAVHRALMGLNLSDAQTNAQSITPTEIVRAMRKWKKRDMFRPSSIEETALTVREESDAMMIKSPEAAPENNSIYYLFASAKKDSSSKPSINPDQSAVANLSSRFSAVKSLDSAENKHLMRWITFLTEVRRQEELLAEALCMASIPSSHFLVRSSMISTMKVGEVSKDKVPMGYDGEGLMASLDELALDMLQYAASSSELRSAMCHIESLLFQSASKASCLVSSHRSEGPENELLLEMSHLGSSILDAMNLDDKQFEMQRILSELDLDFVEEWMHPASSKSPSVRANLALTSNAELDSNVFHSGGLDVQLSAVAVATAHLESIRHLTLARSLLLLSSSESASSATYESGLRASIFCTALLWSINQPSQHDGSRTVLEHYFSCELEASSPNILTLAKNFVRSMFHFYSGASHTAELTSSLVSSSREPRITLRLTAPLVEYPFQTTTTSPNTIYAAAKCLLVEASNLCEPSLTSPKSLWELASKLLSSVVSADSDQSEEVFDGLKKRVDVMHHHLDLMEKNQIILSDCCNIALAAIHDVISFITSSIDSSNKIPELTRFWSLAFETALKGNLWDQALRSCVSSPLSDNRDHNFKRLVLEMVDVKSIGKLVDMSMTVVQPQVDAGDMNAEAQLDICFDIFDAAIKIIEEAACEKSITSSSSADEVEAVLNNILTFWGALYTLHASRGNWKQAAQAMDTCGKAAASVATQVASINKPTSKLIMETLSLSASACYHAISLLSNPADRYLISKDGSIQVEEDIEIRAIRAVALRAFSMDEFAPDSIRIILEANSHDTIDMLARLGYYEHAISMAKGLSRKRKSRPGGIDLFDNSLKHILSTYLVPAATKMSHRVANSGADEDIQSRSKVSQLHLSSTACMAAHPSSLGVSAASINSKSFLSTKHCDQAVQTDLAMNLLRQYTTEYSKFCHGLSLHVARSILLLSEGTYALPHWLKELCAFGVVSFYKNNGLFATARVQNQTADPAGLVRLLMDYHRYEEACDVVVEILSKRNDNLPSSSRIPEKGAIDFVPYNLIDSLHATINNIVETVQDSDEGVQNRLIALRSAQHRMEKALLHHFELTNLSEEGLKSARALAT